MLVAEAPEFGGRFAGMGRCIKKGYRAPVAQFGEMVSVVSVPGPRQSGNPLW